MLRYWRVYKTFFTSSFARELEFKANFIAKLGQNIMWIFFFVMILLVVYGNTKSVAGWDRGDAFVLGATIFLMNAVFNAIFFSLQDIPSQIRLGTMDFVVTKPMDTQFWVSSRRFNFDRDASRRNDFSPPAPVGRTVGLISSPSCDIVVHLLCIQPVADDDGHLARPSRQPLGPCRVPRRGRQIPSRHLQFRNPSVSDQHRAISLPGHRSCPPIGPRRRRLCGFGRIGLGLGRLAVIPALLAQRHAFVYKCE